VTPAVGPLVELGICSRACTSCASVIELARAAAASRGLASPTAADTRQLSHAECRLLAHSPDTRISLPPRVVLERGVQGLCDQVAVWRSVIASINVAGAMDTWPSITASRWSRASNRVPESNAQIRKHQTLERPGDAPTFGTGGVRWSSSMFAASIVLFVISLALAAAGVWLLVWPRSGGC